MNLSISEAANSSLLGAASTLLSLEELLNSLGFDTWMTITVSIVFPVANFLGLIFCSLSAWIFFRGRFTDPVFFYFRLLSIVNILSLLHNIPAAIFYTPRYFPGLNTYATCIYQMYFAGMISALFNFGDVLQIAILLTRMKTFNPFVNRHFTASPKLFSFLFFLAFLLINSPLFFAFSPVSLGNYFFFDSKGNKHEATFYNLSSSQFASSALGSLILGISIFLVNLLILLVIGIVLNIVSFVQYKASLQKRQREVQVLEMSSIHNRATTSMELNQKRQKVVDQRRIKRNMYMGLVLCTISIISRVIIFISAFVFLFYNTFSNSLYIHILTFFIYFFVPAVSFFVFYFFNNTFRKELKRIILRRNENNSSVPVVTIVQ